MRRNKLHWGLGRKSFRVMVNGSFFLTSSTTANTTLTTCASTVAMAAPAASMPKPATRMRSPTMLTTQATSTKSSGDRLSPRPRKMAESRL